MITRDKLRLDEACSKIGYSHFMIKLTCEEEWEKQRALASWRMEIFDYISSLPQSEIKYVLSYFKKYDQVIYLEILTMLSTEKLTNNRIKFGWFFRIIDYIKKFKKGNNCEEICSNSSISIGRNCNIS